MKDLSEVLLVMIVKKFSAKEGFLGVAGLSWESDILC